MDRTGRINMWLAIAPDGVTTVRVNATDLGQGAQTGLAQIVADELDADWSKVEVEMAPVIDDYVKDGNYFTGGSCSIRERFDIFAQAGATARAMLVAAAALHWGADRDQCWTENGFVYDPKGERKLGYGALVSRAVHMPVPDEVDLKEPKDRKLIGKPVSRLDIPDKVNGKTIYGIDVNVPGMKIATMAQCPYFGGTLHSVGDKPALAVKGVEHVVKLDNAMIVVARNFHAAKKGLDALAPQWVKPNDAVESKEAMFAALREEIGAADSDVIVLAGKKKADVINRVNAALSTSDKIYEAEYQVPLLSHSPMEPMNATAHVTGDACVVWVATQVQSDMRDALASALSLPKSAITVNSTHVGGGFGRRLQTDYGVLAARASKAIGAPVKLIWTREDDMTHDFYRPASVGRLRAALNSDKTIRALDYSGATSNDTAVGGIAHNYPYGDLVVRQKKTALQFPIGSWRSVDPSVTIFFIESLVDEIAAGEGLDPLVYRRTLLAGNTHALRVLDSAAETAKWGHAPAGRAQGIGFFNSDYWGTAVCHVVELSVDTSKRITLHKVSCAIDPGLAVNPDAIKAQAEGGIVLGLSAALAEQITLNDGKVEQTNFDAYRILRLAEAPEIEVRVLETPGARPGGCGEPPVPPVAPALANAIYAATKTRVRTLPFSDSGFTV